MKLSFAILLILSLVLSSAFLQSTMAVPNVTPVAAPPPTAPIQGFCDMKCKARCSNAGYWSRCMKYCNICCQDCKCVPSGPKADKSECPCYRDKKNSRGNPKCP